MEKLSECGHIIINPAYIWKSLPKRDQIHFANTESVKSATYRIAWEMIQVQNVFRNVAEADAYVHSFNQDGRHGSESGRNPGPPPILINAHAAQEVAESLTRHASDMREKLAKARDAENAFMEEHMRAEMPSPQDQTTSPVRIKAYSFLSLIHISEPTRPY